MNKKIFLLFLSILVNVHFETAAQINCCCGTPRQMDFPGMDFEIDPFPPLNNYFYFTALYIIISPGVIPNCGCMCVAMPKRKPFNIKKLPPQN